MNFLSVKKYSFVLLTLYFLVPLMSLQAATVTQPGGVVTQPGSFTLNNPLDKNISTIPLLISKILDAFIIIGIPVAVLFVVWAGFKFILAKGNESELRNAKRNFFYVVIGIGIFFFASLGISVLSNTLACFGVQDVGTCSSR